MPRSLPVVLGTDHSATGQSPSTFATSSEMLSYYAVQVALSIKSPPRAGSPGNRFHCLPSNSFVSSDVAREAINVLLFKRVARQQSWRSILHPSPISSSSYGLGEAAFVRHSRTQHGFAFVPLGPQTAFRPPALIGLTVRSSVTWLRRRT